MRVMAFQSTTKFLPGSRWFLGSLQFVTDKFGDLNLQKPESSKVTGSGTDHLHQPRFESVSQMRHNSDTDLMSWERRIRIPLGIKPFTSPELDSEGGGEVRL
jgi:hypothetical protein